MSLNVIDDVMKIITKIHNKKRKKGTDNEIAYNFKRLQHQLRRIQKHPELYLNKKPTIYEHMKTIKRFSDLIEEMPDFELKNRFKNTQNGVFKTEVPGFSEKGSKRYFQLLTISFLGLYQCSRTTITNRLSSLTKFKIFLV